MRIRHVLWANEAATPQGGCERYICDTARLLADRGVSSTLLYDPVSGSASPAMLSCFDQAFPMVDAGRQLADLQPDVIYAHRVHGVAAVHALTGTPIPALRFFHDHRLFCLREHKYRPLSLEPCTRPAGLRCYACPGFINRASGMPGFTMRSLGSLRRELRANDGFRAFVVGSSYMAGHVAAHGFARKRIHVLPLYARVPDGEPAQTREGDLLLFVGQLVRGKGLDVLLEAMTLMRRPARLRIAGTGRQEEAARALSRALGLDARVEFLGHTGTDELATQYRRAACVVLPTRQPETFGLVGPEAMSRDTPVVASAVGGVLEWLEHRRTGLAVPPNQPAALAEALDTVLSDRELRDEMVAEARRRCAERFEPGSHIDALMDLFESVAARGA